MSIASIVVSYAGRKLMERTTWLGITGSVAAYFGKNLPPELANAIADTALAFMTVALIIINERHHGPGSIPKPEASPAREDGAPVDVLTEPDAMRSQPPKAAGTWRVEAGDAVQRFNEDGTITVRGPDGLTRHIKPTG